MSDSHVFVLHTDLMRLACDAWLVPGAITADSFGPGRTWRQALPRRKQWRHAPIPVGERSALLADVDDDAPLPFLTDVTASNRTPPSWFADGARAFLQNASRVLREHRPQPLHGRARHLLALPLLGTRGGGAAIYSGEITSLLLPALQEEARALGVDVALCLNEGASWAAAQKARRQLSGAFDALPAALRDKADALAVRARNGGLTIFVGAGVSIPAGLPSWRALLRTIADEILPHEQRPAFDELAVLDAAALLQQRLPDDVTVNAATAWLLVERSRRYALGHALLASLPVDEVVTTNYDPLFEEASADAGRPCARIPGRPVARGERFILKMHGCVTRPSTIVLTREDYLRFHENKSALAGIVQALLLTRHMLFVGFGFTDDNFHRIAHAVRSALRGDDVDGVHEPFGTNLVLGGTLLKELWQDDLDWIAMSEHAPALSTSEQARLVDIFLDRLSASAANVTSHLGDDRYAGVLSDGEKQLRAHLEQLLQAVTDDEKQTLAWDEVKDLLLKLGISPDGSPVRRRAATPPPTER